MRARALHVIAIAMFIWSPKLSSHADEFQIFDDGSAANSFEIADDGASIGEIIVDPTPAEALTQPLESYPDPVVDQPILHQPNPAPQGPPPEPYPQNYTASPQDGSRWESSEGFSDLDYDYGNYDSCDSGGCSDGCSGGMGGCSGGCVGSCGGGGVFFDMWVAGGFTYNDADPAGGFNTPVTFNDFANEGQLNQAYMSFGKAVDECSRCWDIGGRVDVLYGTDYFFTTADGLETQVDGQPRLNSDDGTRQRAGFTFSDYGLALPQIYGEVFAPIGTGLNVKFGHFYTPLGYESVRAPENFFYSHSYVFQYANPITHTGVLADWAVGSKLNLYAGYTRGWNNWEDANGKPNYLFGFTWCPSRLASLAFGVSTGNEDPAGVNNRSVYSLVYTRRFGRLTYVMEHTFGNEANAEFDANFQSDDAKWYGLNQYFFMDVSPTLTTGMRVEWFRDQDHARVLQLPFESSVSGGNYVGLTMGLNWKPSCNLIIRPEVRYDYSDVEAFGFGNQGVFDDFSQRDQLTVAVDAIFRF